VVGDITQVISVRDSSTVRMESIGTTRRGDNQEVYICLWQYGHSNYDTSYYYIKQDFFTATELQPVTDDSIMMDVNPYYEQHIAKSHPAEGDRWIHTPGDNDTIWWEAFRLETLDIPAGVFTDVFGFRLDGILTTFYGRGFGWLGTGSPFVSGSGPEFICTYKKINGVEYGSVWPAKDPDTMFSFQQKIEIIRGLFILSGESILMINGQFKIN